MTRGQPYFCVLRHCFDVMQKNVIQCNSIYKGLTGKIEATPLSDVLLIKNKHCNTINS